MADKKRKGAATVATPPTKKSKKSPATAPSANPIKEVTEAVATKPTTNDAVSKAKSARKRAADFLGDEEVPLPQSADVLKQSKKARKSSASDSTTTNQHKGKKAILTADGTNGIVEQSGDATVQIATAKESGNTSLQAEGVRTADHELEEEIASEDDDQGAALLAGFDSDSDDPAEDQGDMSKTQPIPQYKKTSKKLRQAQEKGSDGPGTVYVGRIPHGFYEKQMRDYFEQFGTISRLRLSRNKHTGASKHFAFIEFEADEVAKVVAETMDNYLMFGHILKCKYAPSENLHPNVWKGANKKYRRIPHDKLERKQLEAPKTQEQWTKKNTKEQKKREQQAEKLKAIGYEYVVPKLTNPADVVEQRKLDQDQHNTSILASPNGDEPKAIEAPPTVPADEVALKKEKEKKEKKGKKAKADGVPEALTQGNLDARNAGPAAETAKLTQNQKAKDANVSLTDATAATTSKKSKKSKKGSSAITESSHGDYDNLSSIPIGAEAAPASVTDAIPAPTPGPDTISTVTGVADAVLAGRKSDRKKDKQDKAGSSKSSTEKSKVEVSEIAPGAASKGKKEKKEKPQKDKNLKGILKKK